MEYQSKLDMPGGCTEVWVAVPQCTRLHIAECSHFMVERAVVRESAHCLFKSRRWKLQSSLCSMPSRLQWLPKSVHCNSMDVFPPTPRLIPSTPVPVLSIPNMSLAAVVCSSHMHNDCADGNKDQKWSNILQFPTVNSSLVSDPCPNHWSICWHAQVRCEWYQSARSNHLANFDLPVSDWLPPLRTPSSLKWWHRSLDRRYQDHPFLSPERYSTPSQLLPRVPAIFLGIQRL